MALSLRQLLPSFRARARWIENVERAAAECLPVIWPQITAPVRSMTWNEAYGYLRAHAALHVYRQSAAQEPRFLEAVVERAVQLLEQRVHQVQPAWSARRAA